MLQDNTSAIKLETNGQKSMGQRSRHINIRCFFVTDQVQKGNLQIEHCPTDKMQGDYMTKPLQGTKFKGFRTSILNLNQEGSKPIATGSKPLKSCFEKRPTTDRRVTFAEQVGDSSTNENPSYIYIYSCLHIYIQTKGPVPHNEIPA